jgi:hypothetical protein
MREGWTIREGAIEELEQERVERWAALSPNERVEALLQLLDSWKGSDARRLARTYRNVTVPPR